MTTMVLVLLVQGIVQAAIFAYLARRAGPRFAPAMHGGLLVVAGLIYVYYASRAGDAHGLAMEGAGTLVLLGVSFLGIRRRSAGLLAAGWALHPVWDVALHTGGLGGYAPLGYVVTCVGFDFLLAALIWKGWAGMPRAASARTPLTSHAS
ncbi:MAG TPA: DUF6010 family protein [Longimicrobium sp.]|jgi:hypothetical protein